MTEVVDPNGFERLSLFAFAAVRMTERERRRDGKGMKFMNLEIR